MSWVPFSRFLFLLQIFFNCSGHSVYLVSVYSIIVGYLYNLWSDFPWWVLLLCDIMHALSVLLTIFPVLYITFHDCFVTTTLHFVISSHFSPTRPPPLPSVNNQFVPYIHEYVSVLFVNFVFIPFLLNLLGWLWLTKLYRLQVHNSRTHHPYIVFCVHHAKSSLHLSPFIPSYTLPPQLPSSPHNPHNVVYAHEFVLFFLLFLTFSNPPHQMSLKMVCEWKWNRGS